MRLLLTLLHHRRLTQILLNQRQALPKDYEKLDPIHFLHIQILNHIQLFQQDPN